MPWHLPADLARFKALTMGKPIVMGRRTYESIGKPLPGRRNIVVTRDRTFAADAIDVVHSLDEALDMTGAVDEVMVIGGGQLYREVLPRAGRVELTEIDIDLDGDTFFPDLGDGWREVAREARPADDRNPYDLAFITLVRK